MLLLYIPERVQPRRRAAAITVSEFRSEVGDGLTLEFSQSSPTLIATVPRSFLAVSCVSIGIGMCLFQALRPLAWYFENDLSLSSATKPLFFSWVFLLNLILHISTK
jgi:hypothetical protein